MSIKKHIFLMEFVVKFVIASGFLFFASQAFAGSLINKDSSKYSYEVHCGGTTKTSIGANTTNSGGAKKGCTIKLENGATYKVDGDEDVLIKNGKMSKK